MKSKHFITKIRNRQGSEFIFAYMVLLFTLPNFNVFSQKTSVTNFRPPAVPLITTDPYTSCWSFSDKLNESNTKHWTGKNHSMIGYLKVDGKTYRFMGASDVEMDTVAPNGQGEGYEAAYTLKKPTDHWMQPGFDDAQWTKGKGAFGNDGTPSFNTTWTSDDIWVRRQIKWDGTNLDKLLFLIRNDDSFEMYLNGSLVYQSDKYHEEYIHYEVTPEVKKALKKGVNTVAVHCHNAGGPGFIDFGLFRKVEEKTSEVKAIQKSLKITATQTVYEFMCGKAFLKLTFTSPLLLQNLDILSRPASYVTYEIASFDNKSHQVMLYVDLTPEWCVNSTQQEVVWEKQRFNGLIFLKAGTKDQKILGNKGDGVRIDWGHVYLSASTSPSRSFCIDKAKSLRNGFIKNGLLPLTDDNDFPRRAYHNMVSMAMAEDLGKVSNKPVTGHYTIAYDDVYPIQFFGNNLKAWWNRDGKSSFDNMLVDAEKDYISVLKACDDWDTKINNDAFAAGGEEYARVCNLAYRQSIAAHKLVAAPDNTPYFFSKENYSGGFICTVDITFPSAPLFLLYNTIFLKGMMEPIFHYSESGIWTKPFAAHDLGSYPLANGQTYDGDMPVEECGNMLILSYAIARSDNSAEFAKKHWYSLSLWAEYLKDNGFDPTNQLCTDDFAGQMVRNANLSIKATVALKCYSKLAEMLGLKLVSEQYAKIATNDAKHWVDLAKDGDHYMLAFGRPGTWSQKYNLVWDKILDLNLYPKDVFTAEVKYYLTKQNKYGIPLDNRETYTKSDWITWSATLASDNATFSKLFHPIYLYVNETSNRVPISDWHRTLNGEQVGFQARSVVGGYFIKVLGDKYLVK